jgi:hypothetical protein
MRTEESLVNCSSERKEVEEVREALPYVRAAYMYYIHIYISSNNIYIIW